MAHPHYVMDLYFADDEHPERPRHEVLRILADSSEVAIAEGERVNDWRKPRSFQIRSTISSARSGDKVIFLSPVKVAEKDVPVAVRSEAAEVKTAEIGSPSVVQYSPEAQ